MLKTDQERILASFTLFAFDIKGYTNNTILMPVKTDKLIVILEYSWNLNIIYLYCVNNLYYAQQIIHLYSLSLRLGYYYLFIEDQF